MHKMSYKPASKFLGGFTPNDGTIDFYLRVKSLVDPSSEVLDLGAGRAAWFEDDTCETRKTVRNLLGKCKELTAADIDIAVLENKASDKQILISENFDNIKINSFDIIICDYVLEHVEDVNEFFKLINTSLKPGGWFCARTPHKNNYVSIFSRLAANKVHLALLKYLQPSRKEMDVFPAFYKLNSLAQVRKKFNNFDCNSFIYRAEPSYYFGNKYLYTVQHLMHKVLPVSLCGNIFVFLQKRV